MQVNKQSLAAAVRKARTEQGISQEQLAEALNFDTRTILNLEAGRGNPTYETMFPLVTYLKIPANTLFFPDSEESRPNHEALLALLHDCTEQEAELIAPAIRYLLNLLRK